MRLIGQYDSPFVRRVGIALTWYGLPFSQLPLSVFGDADELARWNPLRRVPVLVMDDETALTDTFVCLDSVDELVSLEHGTNWERLLAPRDGAGRRSILRRAALASGAADKVVSLVYEQKIREQASVRWSERCILQVTETLERLELETTDEPPAERLTHADIAVTCLLTFITEAQPSLLGGVSTPKLLRLRERCESRPEFRAVFAPFTVNLPANV